MLTSKVVRFLLVGTANAGVAYGAYAIFLFLGFPYPVANFLALVVGILFGFKTQGTFVFQDPDNRLFPRFVVFWGIMYLVNIGLIAQFMDWRFNPFAAGAVALPVMATLSFLIQNTWVFRHARSSSGPAPGAQNKPNDSGDGE